MDTGCCQDVGLDAPVGSAYAHGKHTGWPSVVCQAEQADLSHLAFFPQLS